MIDTVRFRQASPDIAKQWRQIENDLAEGRVSGDLIVIRKGEAISYLGGVIREVSDKEVKFELEGEVLPVNRQRVEGLVFFHPRKPEFPDPVCIFKSGGNSELQVKSLEASDKELKLTTLAGVETTYTWDHVADLDFSAGKILYLGDVEPDSVKVTKFLGAAIPLELAFHQPRRNRSIDGGRLSLGKESYDRGLAIRSRTELAYRLRGKYRRLLATAGLDNEVRGKGGNVRLVIKGDDKTLYDQPIVDGDDPRPLELDVSGVSRLTILVDFGENGGVADHLDLCDVKVLK